MKPAGIPWNAPTVTPWTPEATAAHLTETFEQAEKAYPDIMEPYTARLADPLPEYERVAVMQAGLRETINQRHPMRAPGPLEGGKAP